MPVSNRCRCIGPLLASLLIAGSGWGWPPAKAADLLELRLDGLEIPINLTQLEAWSRRERRPGAMGGELEVWLSMLDRTSRRDLIALLRAPLLHDQSFGRQLLDSWAGGQMLAALGNLLTTPEGASTTPLLQSTLVRMLERGKKVSAIELLRALPVPSVSLQLDGLIDLAQNWRQQLRLQRQAVVRLRQLNLPLIDSRPLAFSARPWLQPVHQQLMVAHRSDPLPLQIWTAPRQRLSRSSTSGGGTSSPPWLLLMPGLGGNADQLGWLAAVLAQRGWTTVVLQHPGSDAAALKASLDGQRPPPGAETLATRLADVEAVLAAQRQGSLSVQGNGVVLMGHSLGGLTALLAAGLKPEPGLEARCRKGLGRLPITNPSRLLQCQLPSVGVPTLPMPPADLRGVVVLNGFGSLLWPDRGLTPLAVPVLLEGGSLDLVTPPLQEQLDLFLPSGDRRSRLVVVEGGSHFSPVRMTAREKALVELSEELVGVDPLAVQDLLLRLTTEFLLSLDSTPMLSQRWRQEEVTAYVLDAASARRWHDGVRP